MRITNGDPRLSHIFFVDDLLLFDEASFFQARMMEYILGQFCEFSRQRMNGSKSRIWFLPNTPIYLRNSICFEFHVAATSDLRTYLGIPLFHGRTTRTFDYLVERAQKRLAKWKMTSLSRAVRLVIIKSILLALPTYAMQACILPGKISKAIEKILEIFFWGSTTKKRTLHAVAWRRICQPMAHGRPGINGLRKSNIALVCKLS